MSRTIQLTIFAIVSHLSPANRLLRAAPMNPAYKMQAGSLPSPTYPEQA
jgi:hypothetical protein